MPAGAGRSTSRSTLPGEHRLDRVVRRGTVARSSSPLSVSDRAPPAPASSISSGLDDRHGSSHTPVRELRELLRRGLAVGASAHHDAVAVSSAWAPTWNSSSSAISRSRIALGDSRLRSLSSSCNRATPKRSSSAPTVSVTPSVIATRRLPRPSRSSPPATASCEGARAACRGPDLRDAVLADTQQQRMPARSDRRARAAHAQAQRRADRQRRATPQRRVDPSRARGLGASRIPRRPRRCGGPGR